MVSCKKYKPQKRLKAKRKIKMEGLKDSCL